MIKQTTLIPKTYHGWEVAKSLNTIIEPMNVRNILIVADPFLVSSGLITQVTDSLKSYQLSLFTEIDPEPSLALGERIVNYTRNQNADLVIGIGGGSALDLAKIAATLATHEGEVSRYLNLTGDLKPTHKGLPKIMIPTTSGTGSEVTNLAVLSLAHSKDVIVSDHLLADVALLDPSLTVTVPPRVTAATGVDALTHAIEAYLSINADPITDQLALNAIELINQSLFNAYKNGEDQQARTQMSYGSYLAGIAFFNAGAGAVHALAYPLGGQFHISHGESNALLLPYVLTEIEVSAESRLAKIGEKMNLTLTGKSVNEAARMTVLAIQSLLQSINIPSSLQFYEIEQRHLTNLATDAIKQQRLLVRTPKNLTENDIFRIYSAAWHGKIELLQN